MKYHFLFIKWTPLFLQRRWRDMNSDLFNVVTPFKNWEYMVAMYLSGVPSFCNCTDFYMTASVIMHKVKYTSTFPLQVRSRLCCKVDMRLMSYFNNTIPTVFCDII